MQENRKAAISPVDLSWSDEVRGKGQVIAGLSGPHLAGSDGQAKRPCMTSFASGAVEIRLVLLTHNSSKAASTRN